MLITDETPVSDLKTLWSDLDAKEQSGFRAFAMSALHRVAQEVLESSVTKTPTLKAEMTRREQGLFTLLLPLSDEKDFIKHPCSKKSYHEILQGLGDVASLEHRHGLMTLLRNMSEAPSIDEPYEVLADTVREFIQVNPIWCSLFHLQITDDAEPTVDKTSGHSEKAVIRDEDFHIRPGPTVAFMFQVLIADPYSFMLIESADAVFEVEACLKTTVETKNWPEFALSEAVLSPIESVDDVLDRYIRRNISPPYIHELVENTLTPLLTDHGERISALFHDTEGNKNFFYLETASYVYRITLNALLVQGYSVALAISTLNSNYLPTISVKESHFTLFLESLEIDWNTNPTLALSTRRVGLFRKYCYTLLWYSSRMIQMIPDYDWTRHYTHCVTETSHRFLDKVLD